MQKLGTDRLILAGLLGAGLLGAAFCFAGCAREGNGIAGSLAEAACGRQRAKGRRGSMPCAANEHRLVFMVGNLWPTGNSQCRIPTPLPNGSSRQPLGALELPLRVSATRVKFAVSEDELWYWRGMVGRALEADSAGVDNQIQAYDPGLAVLPDGTVQVSTARERLSSR